MQAVLSRDLLSAIRFHLHDDFKGIKNAHLTEALAAAFGHRTNASLLAFIGNADPAVCLTVDVDSEAAEARLVELGYAGMGIGPSLPEAFAKAGVLITGPNYQAPNTGARSRFHKGGWSALKGREVLNQMAFFFTTRMDAAGIMNYVYDFADRGGRDHHLRLATCIQMKRDIDRLTADFLVFLILDAERTEAERQAAVSEGDMWSSPLERFWYGDVFDVLRLRVFAFLDGMSSTWDDKIDPWEIPKLMEVPGRPKKPIRLNPGRSKRDLEIGLKDFGHRFKGSTGAAYYRHLVAASALALWRSGTDLNEITTFAVMAASDDHVLDRCLQAVPMSEGSTREEFQAHFAPAGNVHIERTPLQFLPAGANVDTSRYGIYLKPWRDIKELKDGVRTVQGAVHFHARTHQNFVLNLDFEGTDDIPELTDLVRGVLSTGNEVIIVGISEAGEAAMRDAIEIEPGVEARRV